jgi:hypothetical protein
LLAALGPAAVRAQHVDTSLVTNQGASATPTPTRTPEPLPCVGDCNADLRVSVGELVVGVEMGLGLDDVDRCPAIDFFADGVVTIEELLLAVGAAKQGCRPATTPTPGVATLAEIQDTIFTPRCAVLSCHAAPFPIVGLNLEEGESFGSLVGQRPSNFAAAQLGLLRVDPENPDNSFLLIKVEGPDSTALGSRMPILPPNLSAAQIRLIRDWIAAGAEP